MSHPFARTKTPLNAQMNVVPYIDVMLVLLVIFMVTAPILTTGVDVSLPSADAQVLSIDKPVIIALKKDAMYLTTPGDQDKKVDDDMLANALTDLPNFQQMTVMIYADKNLQYNDVISLMAKVQALGIKKVGLLTEPLPQ